MGQMWKTAAETRQAMCPLIDVRFLPAVDKMCAAHADTPVVIDHFARIGSDGTIRDADIALLCSLARHKQVSVKVSAFYALGEKKPPHLELVPMIRRLFETFGPQRLMWASDSPYQLQKGNDYASSIGLVRDKLDFVSAADRQRLLCDTAERIFFFR
jgi:predicted TIM-barrel fold metal-dependent hydrolase